MKNKIGWNILESGQQRPYADSIYKYEIESELYEGKIKEFCVKFLCPATHEGGGGFSGACSFPHGLDSYYSFEKISENKYRYKVCQPYTG